MVGKFLKSSLPLTKYGHQNLRRCAHSTYFSKGLDFFSLRRFSIENFKVSHIKPIFLDIEEAMRAQLSDQILIFKSLLQ